MKVAVVTPTIGSPSLRKCIHSIQKQTYNNLTHYVFVDGGEHNHKVYPIIHENKDKEIKTVSLEENVGKGWYGHRVYAACSFLVNADVICYLDEDNWFEENHVETLVKTLEDYRCSWAYSFRKIYDSKENFVCNDECESLGKWPVYFNDNVYHIDTSSFAVRKEVALKIGHSWYGQWGADRQFFNALKQHFPEFECTKQHTLCYRLDGNDNSVTKEFFEKGNAVMHGKYETLPWNVKEEIILTF